MHAGLGSGSAGSGSGCGKQVLGRRGEGGGQAPRERINARLHWRGGDDSRGGSGGADGNVCDGQAGQRRFAGARRPPIGRVVRLLCVHSARVRVALVSAHFEKWEDGAVGGIQSR